jgi:tRNA threonylcarbamoyladenosine biosynthesis protein TsaB
VLVLGIETATTACSVAIGGEQGIVASALATRRRHDEYLMPAIDFLFREAGIEREQLTGVAADLGPGLFTGMRVGVATAKALARALSLPIAGLPSLDVLAHAVRFSPRLICAAIDARRAEVFCAFYRAAAGGAQRVGEVQVLPPNGLAAEIEARGVEVLLVGDGALRYRDELESEQAEFAPASLAHPSASALVELAIPRFLRGQGDSLQSFAPLYVRRTDAEINWERSGVVIERPERVKVSRRRAAGG